MKRREFLAGSTATFGTIPEILKSQPTAFSSRLASIVVGDISADVSLPHLATLLSALTLSNLPVSCIVSADLGSNLDPRKTVQLIALLSSFVTKNEDVQIIPLAPNISELSTYFQSRIAYEANAAIRDLFFPFFDLANRRSFGIALACNEFTQPRSPVGVRSAGIRTVLTIPTNSSEVSSETWPNGVVRFFGGQLVDINQSQETQISKRLNSTQSLLYLSARDLQEHSIAKTSSNASKFAERLLDAESRGKISIQPVADILLRDDFAFQSLFSLHIEADRGDETSVQQAFETLLFELAKRKIPFSIAESKLEKERYWLPVVSNEHYKSFSIELDRVSVEPTTGVQRFREKPADKILPGQQIAFDDASSSISGIDRDAILWLPAIDIGSEAEALNFYDRIGEHPDLVVVLNSKAVLKPYALTAFLRQLDEIVSNDAYRVIQLQRFGQLIAPKGPEINRQRLTLARSQQVKRSRPTISDKERQLLVEDARIAWRYFDDNTIPSTGLCPATVNFSRNNGRIHPSVTMWDVGSHINALVAARQLRLITKKRFEKNISQILSQIHGRKTQQRMLPLGWIRVDRHRWGNRDFDGSDAGRLLSSLLNLRRNFGFEDSLEALVGRWDLEKIVVGGEVHSVKSGKLHSVYRSHSAHYAARAFRSWNINAASPYEVFENRSQFDGQMALLERVSWIGPLGAEPLLLEALELGMSEESAYLAEVLFAAHLEHYEETGKFVAVSEGPIDKAPWFTYQGLQLDALERTWALDTVGFEPRYNDPVFWRDNLVVSSKAAYLWAAHKPHDYSSKLLAFVRERAQTKQGFASSIFDRSGRATITYTDLNTNAIILQAISNILRDT